MNSVKEGVVDLATLVDWFRRPVLREVLQKVENGTFDKLVHVSEPHNTSHWSSR